MEILFKGKFFSSTLINHTLINEQMKVTVSILFKVNRFLLE